MRSKFLLPAVLLLIAVTRINFDTNPLFWPDEALFSSPAANLVENGSFGSPVLEGLIPGMEKATLWNSPLFMVMLSGVYALTGEDLQWARSLSLIIAFAALYFFLLNLELIVSERILLFILPLVLVYDLTFQRSANTGRMDMLTLLFFLMTHHQLLMDFLGKDQGKSARRFFLAGIFTGFAGLSHPFAVILIPVLAIYAFPDIKKFIFAALGTALSFSLWLIYIIPNFNIFLIQFGLQMKRKPDMFLLWGGDTGGIFKVFFSQYGSAVMMILGLLVFLAVLSAVLNYAWKIRKNILHDPFFRIAGTFAVITGFALVSSEGWYVLYCGPFFLILLAYLSSRAKIDMRKIHSLKSSLIQNDLPLVLLSLFFIVSTVHFTYRQHFVMQTSSTVSSFLKSAVTLSSECRSVYLRVRPDPYFHLRKINPEMEILEFVPGKLRSEDNQKDLYSRYDQIECFLLDANDSWEPGLTDYLSANKEFFNISYINYSGPVGNNRLFRRK